MRAKDMPCIYSRRLNRNEFSSPKANMALDLQIFVAEHETLSIFFGWSDGRLFGPCCPSHMSQGSMVALNIGFIGQSAAIHGKSLSLMCERDRFKLPPLKGSREVRHAPIKWDVCLFQMTETKTPHISNSLRNTRFPY